MHLIYLGTAASHVENAPLQGENFPQTCVSAKSIRPVFLK